MSLVADIRALFGTEPNANGHRSGTGDFWSGFAGGGQGYAAAALVREAEGVASAAEGRRNHTLNAAAFSLGQLVAGGALNEAQVAAALTDAGRRAGLEPLEVQRTIASGLRSGAAHPRGVPDRPTGLILPRGIVSVAGAATDELVDEEALVREHLPLLDWRALWDDPDSEDWIVEPLLPARRLIALYSAPKVGKSLLMLELAVAVARAEPILGVTPDRPRRVLYVDFENDPRGDVKERLIAMGHGPDDLGNLCYLSFPQLAALDSAPGGAQLMAAVRAYACEVVVIDTVSRSIAGEENENDTWLNFYRHTGKALKAAGIALVRLDHTGKDETRGQRGGSAKSGDVDAVWRMSKVTETTFRLECEANRMPVVEKVVVIHRELLPKLRHRVDGEGRTAARRAKVMAVVDLLDSLDVPLEAGSTKVRAVARSQRMKISNEDVAEAIRIRKDPLRSIAHRSGGVPDRYPTPEGADRSRTEWWQR